MPLTAAQTGGALGIVEAGKGPSLPCTSALKTFYVISGEVEFLPSKAATRQTNDPKVPDVQVVVEMESPQLLAGGGVSHTAGSALCLRSEFIALTRTVMAGCVMSLLRLGRSTVGPLLGLQLCRDPRHMRLVKA
jgi:hypothetical protein